MQALTLALGPAVILQYLLQGLFHPARKVRNVYWRLYNNVYIAKQDALVEFYPLLDFNTNQSVWTPGSKSHNDDNHDLNYRREECLYFV